MDKWFLIVGFSMVVAAILTFEPNFDIVDGWQVLWYNSNDLHKHRKYIRLWKRRQKY